MFLQHFKDFILLFSSNCGCWGKVCCQSQGISFQYNWPFSLAVLIILIFLCVLQFHYDIHFALNLFILFDIHSLFCYENSYFFSVQNENIFFKVIFPPFPYSGTSIRHALELLYIYRNCSSMCLITSSLWANSSVPSFNPYVLSLTRINLFLESLISMTIFYFHNF